MEVFSNNKKVYHVTCFEIPEIPWTWSEYESRGPGAKGQEPHNKVGGPNKSTEELRNELLVFLAKSVLKDLLWESLTYRF